MTLSDLIFIIILVVMLIFGALFCFGGYKHYKYATPIVLFFSLLFFVNITLLPLFTTTAILDMYFYIAIGIIILLTIICSANKAFKLFCTGGTVGLVLTFMFQLFFNSDYKILPLFVFIIGISLFIAFGIVTYVFRPYAAAVITAITGGVLLTVSLLYLFSTFENSMRQSSTIQYLSELPLLTMIIPLIAFCVSGIILQVSNYKNRAVYAKAPTKQEFTAKNKTAPIKKDAKAPELSTFNPNGDGDFASKTTLNNTTKEGDMQVATVAVGGFATKETKEVLPDLPTTKTNIDTASEVAKTKTATPVAEVQKADKDVKPKETMSDTQSAPTSDGDINSSPIIKTNDVDPLKKDVETTSPIEEKKPVKTEKITLSRMARHNHK